MHILGRVRAGTKMVPALLLFLSLLYALVKVDIIRDSVDMWCDLEL